MSEQTVTRVETMVSLEPSRTAGAAMGLPKLVRTETQTWIATTDEGSAVLTLPRNLTVDDVIDLEAWFALVLRSVQRQQVNAARKNSSAVQVAEP